MKFSITLLLAVFSITTAFAQPSNDDCSGAIDLGVAPLCSEPADYTNVNATASSILPTNIPDCFNGGGVQRDVWFVFTVPPDGSLVDFTVQILGNINGNGTLQNPQVAVYRGDCPSELDMLDCAAAPNGTNEVTLDLLGLTPGAQYYIRVNDFSSTATPNAGTFKLCVNEYISEFIMGQTPSSNSCEGTLYDSGGPDEDYQSSENLSFTVCPQDFHQCIIFNVTYDVENIYDQLSFIQGANSNDPVIITVDGTDQNFEVQVPGNCATITFSSDATVTAPGFTINWNCTPSPCTTPPISTCDDPIAIPSLPYSVDTLNNCFSGNAITSDPCFSGFINGNDYIFTYESTGNECIQVAATGTNIPSGLGVYTACPSEPGAACVAIQDLGNIGGDPVIEAAFLEAPGTYYIVFGSINGDCTPFTLSVDTVTCPVLLPSASTCDQALNIGGCNTTAPEVIALNPGQGDPSFIQDGVNQGCFVGAQENFVFFYFKAAADGKFGFTAQPADPNEVSDIDFSVWGPIDSFDDICDFSSNNQPVRSSWTGLIDPPFTGMADVHPGTGDVQTDEFDCGSPNTPGADGDAFVRRLDVIKDKYYLVMLDDWGQQIEQGGLAMDFSGTTPGVLVPEGGNPVAGTDTTICPGQSAQLNASGGAAYFWYPADGLSCVQCADPVATPNQPTVYQVTIASTCATKTIDVEVDLFKLQLGPDATVCSGAVFELNPGAPSNANYVWSGPNLSCTNCPTPTVGPLAPGTYTYIGSLLSNFCLYKDTLIVTVLNAPQPQYDIADDMTVCVGQTVQLGGVAQPGTFYQWSASIPGFTSNSSNPSVSPTQDIVYYLSATNGSCPVAILDSVVVEVNPSPTILVAPDTSICIGEPVQLGYNPFQDFVTYSWAASAGTVDQPTAANPIEMPLTNTTYTLTATLDGCSISNSVDITVVPLILQLNTPDSIAICQGTDAQIQVAVSPVGVPVQWGASNSLVVAPNGLSAVATPIESSVYSIKSSLNGCNREILLKIAVDSLPDDLDIHPSDTTVCKGSQVLLRSPIYEPAEYEYMDFAWSPSVGQLTPDSLFNMVIVADTTTIYRRITRNGACADTAFALVNVIKPPEIMVTPSDTSICPNQPVQLLAIAPPDIENPMWTPATGLSCTNCPNPIAIVPGTTQFTYTGTYQNCPAGATVLIEITDPPAVQFPTDVILCKGESITLNSVTSPNSTYSWTANDPAFPGSNQAQPSVVPTQPSTTYTVTASNGCVTTSSVTVTMVDATLTVNNDTSVCRFEPVQLTASGSQAGTFAWSNGQTAQSFVETVNTTGTYTVTYTYGDGCTQTADVTVTVNGESVPLNLPPPTQICPGDDLLLNTEAPPTGATYTWTASPNDPSLVSTASNPTVSPNASTTYTVVATLGLCTATRTVTVNVAAGSVRLPADTVLCAGDALTLAATATPGTLLWSTGETTASISTTPLASTTYQVTLTYGNNCTLTDAVTVTVTPSFVLGIVAAPPGPEIEIGDALELAATINPTTGLQQFSFEWKENNVETIGTAQVLNTTVVTEDSIIRYVVRAVSPGGCIREEEIFFRVVQPNVVVPNAFTPNGDTINSSFGLIFLKGSGTIENLEIYNRWGQKVFASTETITTWDGNVGGKPAPMDTYVYRIMWRRKDGALQAPLTGEVTLIR